MSDLWTWVAISGIVLATFVTRSGPLLLGDRARLPPLVDQALTYAPGCALAAIIVPELLLAEGALRLSFDNFRLLAALTASAAFMLTRNLLVTIAIGMGAFTALRLLA